MFLWFAKCQDLPNRNKKPAYAGFLFLLVGILLLCWCMSNKVLRGVGQLIPASLGHVDIDFIGHFNAIAGHVG